MRAATFCWLRYFFAAAAAYAPAAAAAATLPPLFFRYYFGERACLFTMFDDEAGAA